ncbi:MAG TPA: Mur ligase family protein, partial [Microvirga sp.]|nr:Mur ligase family protein [Microvirga sp.]
MDSSDALIARFLALHPKTIDLSLGRIQRLLGELGNPERRLPPAIHVAGTNGKGSTIAFMRAILESAGLAVHVYTSPHLVRFHERIRLGQFGGGRYVTEDRLVEAFRRCEAVNGGEPITVFEITTAAALLIFAEEPADVLLLEVGLGGRLDATNVIGRPLATAITPVSMDHMQFLGDTLPAIAGEKAGILKAGVPAAIGPQPPEAMAVIEARAAEIGAPLYCFGADWSVEPD